MIFAFDGILFSNSFSKDLEAYYQTPLNYADEKKLKIS